MSNQVDVAQIIAAVIGLQRVERRRIKQIRAALRLVSIPFGLKRLLKLRHLFVDGLLSQHGLDGRLLRFAQDVFPVRVHRIFQTFQKRLGFPRCEPVQFAYDAV